jgi:BirA family biotin operon repressor/biotin-[acetyl-CoA-carboxylase] ligase
MEAMDRWRGLWLAQGFAPVASAWTARAHGLGAPCVAVLTHERVEGIAEGLDADGALRLRTASGEVRRITAGDVFF